MINDLQKIVKTSKTEVEMLKEKCEKYVSVKNCVIVFADRVKFLLNISHWTACLTLHC